MTKNWKPAPPAGSVSAPMKPNRSWPALFLQQSAGGAEQILANLRQLKARGIDIAPFLG